MSLKESSTIDVGYPVYEAKFVNNKTLLVVGGGGEGNNGIPNKITAIKCSFKIKDKSRRLQRFREITLPANEDSPNCIDVSRVDDIMADKPSYQVFVGCNQSTQLIKSMNINNHLRKYSFTGDEHLKFIDAAQLEPEISGDDSGVYPKILGVSRDNALGLMMTSDSTVYLFDSESLECVSKFQHPTEIKDIKFSLLASDQLAFITASSLEFASFSNNSVSITDSTNNHDQLRKLLSKYILTKVRYINENELLLTANVRKGGVALLKYSISDKAFTKILVLSKKLKGLVAMDFSEDQNLVAVAANDCSLTIVRLSDFKVLKTYNKLHAFAITSVAFSPNGSKLASVSAANSVHVFKIPKNFAKGSSFIGSMINYTFYSLLFAIAAIALQISFENGQLKEYYAKTKEVGSKSADVLSVLAFRGVDLIKDKLNKGQIESAPPQVVPTTLETSIASGTPMGEPVDTASDIVSEVSYSDMVSSIPISEQTIETSIASTFEEEAIKNVEYVANATVISEEVGFSDKPDEERYEADIEKESEESDEEGESNEVPQAESESESEPEVEPVPEPEAEPVPEPEVIPEPEVEPVPEPEVEPVPEPEAEPEIEEREAEEEVESAEETEASENESESEEVEESENEAEKVESEESASETVIESETISESGTLEVSHTIDAETDAETEVETETVSDIPESTIIEDVTTSITETEVNEVDTSATEEISQSETEAETSESEASETEASETEASETEVSESETNEAEVSESETSEAEVSGSEASESEASESEASESEASESEISQSEVSESETAEASESEASETEDISETSETEDVSQTTDNTQSHTIDASTVSSSISEPDSSIETSTPLSSASTTKAPKKKKRTKKKKKTKKKTT